MFCMCSSFIWICKKYNNYLFSPEFMQALKKQNAECCYHINQHSLYFVPDGIIIWLPHFLW